MFYGILFLLSSIIVARTFQPEFPGMLGLILGYGKTWIIVLLGSFIALLPDFVFQVIKITYFPDPTDRLIKFLKENNQIMDVTMFTEDRRDEFSNKLE
jgi:hypothetical protein